MDAESPNLPPSLLLLMTKRTSAQTPVWDAKPGADHASSVVTCSLACSNSAFDCFDAEDRGWLSLSPRQQDLQDVMHAAVEHCSAQQPPVRAISRKRSHCRNECVFVYVKCC